VGKYLNVTPVNTAMIGTGINEILSCLIKPAKMTDIGLKVLKEVRV